MSRQIIRVELGQRSYDVIVGPGELAELGPTAHSLGGVRRAVIIADTTVAELYGQRALDSLAAADLPGELLTFPAGEENKHLGTCASLYEGLFGLSPAIDRRTLIIALGGGVSGDVAGFIAATALRGLRWLQCPTTLLADVDASVGGKTGVDHPAGKNLIGAFHQPRGVLIDVDLLATLSDEHLACGLAECVKHGVIRDATLLALLEDRAEAIADRDPAALTELVARNVAIKAAVVAADEREAGQREHLNFGHTVGHAIEAFVGYDRITHGAAVSLGMIAAMDLAVRRELLTAADAARVGELLNRLHLPTAMDGLDFEAIWRIMQHDKKARDGRVRMILPAELGAVAAYDDVDPAEVRQAVDALSPA